MKRQLDNNKRQFNNKSQFNNKCQAKINNRLNYAPIMTVLHIRKNMRDIAYKYFTNKEYALLHHVGQEWCEICGIMFEIGVPSDDENGGIIEITYTKSVIEHDHETGDYRGRVCVACNAADGKYKNYPQGELIRTRNYFSKNGLCKAYFAYLERAEIRHANYCRTHHLSMACPMTIEEDNGWTK